MATTEPAVTEGADGALTEPTGQGGQALEPEAALDLVLHAAHRPAEVLWATLEDRMESTVHAAVREALAGHAEQVESMGLGGEAPEDAEAAADALRAYRHTVADQVLPQLELALERHRPTLMVAREVAAAFEKARADASALPLRHEVRWGTGALQALPTDKLGRRVAKVAARFTSKARKPDASRPAPLRSVALYHLEARVAPVLADAVVDGVKAWAGWVARLERVCVTWAGEVLPVLTRVDAPSVPAVAEEGNGAERSGDSDPEGERSAGSAGRGWEHLRASAERFAAELEELLEESPHQQARERAEARLEPAVLELSSDVRVVGSFVLKDPGSGASDPRLVSLDRVQRKFEAWDGQAAARIHMYRAFLEILLGSRAVSDRLEGRVRDTVLERLGELEGCLEGFEALASEARGQSSDESLVGKLPALRKRAEEVASHAVRSFPEASAVDEALDGIVGDAIDALQAIIRQSPSTLVLHRLPESATAALRPDDTRSVEFQERARRSLDAMRIERIRAAVLELGAGLGPIRASLAELPDVVAFAFDAAQSELEGGGTEVKEASEEGRPGDRAARLALEALERSAGVVREVPAQVEALLDRTRDGIDAQVVVGAEALLDRLGAGRMQSQLLRARSSFYELWLRVLDRVGPTVRWMRRATRYRYLRSRRATRRMLRAVRGMVGEAPVSDARAARTIRAFAHADSGPGHVPLVYQRLFSMEPVTDPSFLVGRAAELADVLKRWRHWREEDEVPLVVRGYPGVGVTSFLNGCKSLLEEQGAEVVRMEVPERLLEEAPLASLVASTLGVQAEESLADLAKRVLAVRRGAVPDVVILDGLEHLYLRVPQGTDLLERLLTLMSETEPRTFWLAGVGQPAWQLLGKVEATAVLQVDGLQLPPLSADRLKETILQRHRRSGLRLRFLEPREGRALLRRRARRLRGTEGHQRLLEQDFFEQLHRISLGNLKLAMFHWLLAADFEAKEGEVLLHPLVRPDFSVLEGLGDTQNFTLKALLEHRTLTLDEYCRVFRVGRQESYQIFESLQNRRLVEEMAPPPPVTEEGSELERSSRYRIRPLLVGAVTAHLRKRNIVH